MCGFAGFIDATPSRSRAELVRIATDMTDAIVHRGPDDGAMFVDPSVGVALGFRRLAIIDLSPQGNQPMTSASDRYIVAFNGEIYNYTDLRQELLQHHNASFRGHSDTEVLLAAIEQWGVEQALQRATGMFALALWDRKDRTLHLARDRMGEKPLYYGWNGSAFFFGSELKSFRRHPNFRGELNRDALIPYLRQSYIPAPWSIWRNIWKLTPGTWLSIDPTKPGRVERPKPYWSARAVVESAAHHRFRGSFEEGLTSVEDALQRAARRQMIADVPLGAFLSGGVDSSAIVALMQSQSTQPVKTFTIGFHEKEFNEAEHAKAVAKHLHTDHTELYVAADTMLDVLPRLPALYDEPFADSSQIPTFLVAQMARRYVTVSLSGDGGDEVFAGYTWYRRARALWRKLRTAPPPMRWGILTALKLAPHSLRQRLPQWTRGKVTPQRIEKLQRLLAQSQRIESLHQQLIAADWNDRAVRNAREPVSLLSDFSDLPRIGSSLDRLQCYDMLTYLPDDILVKVDRAAMGTSLETRAPFLDHHVIERVFALPTEWRMRNGETKHLLRQILYKYVPRELIERPKAGFCVPMAKWLRGPLREWADDLLSPTTVNAADVFDADIVQTLWREHQSGVRDWQRQLWSLLMFQQWHRSVTSVETSTSIPQTA